MEVLPMKKIGALTSIPLFYIDIVILPLFFLLCEFVPAYSKRSTTLSLFRHPPLMVLTFVPKDKYALVILPLVFRTICDFTPNLE